MNLANPKNLIETKNFLRACNNDLPSNLKSSYGSYYLLAMYAVETMAIGSVKSISGDKGVPVCSHCYNDLKNGDVFCSHCGGKIITKEEAKSGKV